MGQLSKSLILISAVVVVAFAAVTFKTPGHHHAVTVATPYGIVNIQEPILVELLHSKAIQRLKGIHQYGVSCYACPTEAYSRYDHSVGVLALLKRYGFSLDEQITGLLHDTSHTVFSHVGDFVFKGGDTKGAYQDDIHLWYLNNSGLVDILSKYGYTPQAVHPSGGKFLGLEQELPALCADRIEYNLQGGFRRGLLTQEDVDTILSDLHYDHPHWYFSDPDSAKKLAKVSLNLTEHQWGSPWALLIYTWTSEAIKQAMATDVITMDDFHFSVDDHIWYRLVASTDPIIKENIDKVLNFERHYSLTDLDTADVVVYGKFRGLDPLVLTTAGLKLLTEVDASFAEEYYRTKAVMHHGWGISLQEKLQVSNYSGSVPLPQESQRELQMTNCE